MNKQFSILIAEDEEDQRSRLAYVLESEGYTVDEAETADEAIEMLNEKKYDMVITDMRMPGKNDGFDLLVAVKKITNETIVIVITAYGSVDGAVRCMINGAYDYMQKPIQMPELRIKIARAFQARSENKQYLEVKEFKKEMDQVIKKYDNLIKRLKNINKISKSILNEINIEALKNKKIHKMLNEIINESSKNQF